MGKITILPPYVEPKHRVLLDAAEQGLREFEEALLTHIKKDISMDRDSLTPHPYDLEKAERLFKENPTRQAWLKALFDLKLLVERPRLFISRVDADKLGIQEK